MLLVGGTAPSSLLKKSAACTSGAEAQFKIKILIAAVNRCATQKREFLQKTARRTSSKSRVPSEKPHSKARTVPGQRDNHSTHLDTESVGDAGIVRILEESLLDTAGKNTLGAHYVALVSALGSVFD